MSVGEFTAENQLLAKIEREKLRARIDPWKVGLFECFCYTLYRLCSPTACSASVSLFQLLNAE